jgi:hypothetical protein
VTHTLSANVRWSETTKYAKLIGIIYSITLNKLGRVPN